jgi:hypothetical protein
MGLFDQDDKQARLDLQKTRKRLKWEKPLVVAICFIIAFLIGVFKVYKLGNDNIMFILGGALGYAVVPLILSSIVALIAKLLKFRWHYAFAISFVFIMFLTLILNN